MPSFSVTTTLSQVLLFVEIEYHWFSTISYSLDVLCERKQNFGPQKPEKKKLCYLGVQKDGQTGKIQVTCQSNPVHLEYLGVFQTLTVSTKHKYFDELAILEKMFDFSALCDTDI